MRRNVSVLQPRWLTRGLASAGGAAMFVAPLLVLVLIWAIAEQEQVHARLITQQIYSQNAMGCSVEGHL